MGIANHYTTAEEFISALEEQYWKKNAAYGNSAHRTFVAWGETAYLVRISDKINRMNQLLSQPKTDDIGESIVDTLGDCITYMLMLLADCKAADTGITYEDAITTEFAWAKGNADDYAYFVTYKRFIDAWKERGDFPTWLEVDIDSFRAAWKNAYFSFSDPSHMLRCSIAYLTQRALQYMGGVLQ